MWSALPTAFANCVDTMRTRIALSSFAAIFSLSQSVAMAAETTAGVDATSLARMIVGLGIVIAVIIGLAWFLRRLGRVGHNAGGQLKILGGLAVGQRERVVLIQVGEQQLLVGVAPGRVQTLHVLDQPLEDVQGQGSSARARQGAFADRLHRAMQQQNEKR